MMLTGADSNEDTKPANISLLADVTDDSCRFQYIEIVPLTRDTTDCDNGEWSAQVKQENLTVVKQEPHDDDVISVSCCTTNDADLDEVDGTQSHMKPVCVLKKLNLRLNLTRVKQECNVAVNPGSCTDGGTLTADSKSSHTGEQLYSCSHCGKNYRSRSSFCQHMNTHMGKYKCTECGRCCQSSQSLAAHKRTHSGEKPFECYVCSKRFTEAVSLDVHSRIHTGEKPYKCLVCDKAFSGSGDLSRHMRVHTGDKPYKCSLCDKSFNQSSSLQSHKRQVHSNRRSHECPYCGKLFKTNIELKSHVHIHTGAKPNSCRHCSERFTWLNQLKAHLLKSHNEGTWLTCHICQKKFSRSDSFRTHVRRHEGVKPYVCSDCPKCFCTRDELRSHMTVHLKDVA